MEKLLEPKILEEDYYVLNFLKLLNFVMERYHDVLNEEEIAFYDQFIKLSNQEQRLFVRLMSRKGPYFRLNKLQYSEIDDLEQVVESLSEKDFLHMNPREGLGYALDTWLVDELKEMGRFLGIESSDLNAGKPQLLGIIMQYDEGEIWPIVENQDNMMIPAYYQEIRIFKTLFFGNSYQDLSDFILEDIGVLKYEPYQLAKEDRYFDTRRDLELSLEKDILKQELWMAIETQDIDWLEQIKDFISERLIETDNQINYDQELNRIGALYEKLKLYDQASESFALSSLHPANERQIRILDKQGKHHEALDACDMLINSSNHYEETLFAKFYLEEQKRKLGLAYTKRKRLKVKDELVILERQAEMPIEEQVVNHLNEIGILAFYTENRLWKALFALSFWDIMFSRQPGVFYHPFQRGPRDLRSSKFRELRSAPINQRLEAIKNGSFISEILKTYDKKHLTANAFINWKQVSYEQIEEVLKVIPNEQLACILDRMAHHPGEFSSGFPDIFAFTEDRFELVEVKGPGDRLRPNQRAWLKYFEEQKIPFKVMNVAWEA